ncbi:alpha/beta fold hydrolase [Gordonia rubripertincta]|uniref:alpha/beta fold hydrolase n=1 Tax=Gordonia rubripertincta TaxID=36822 RepID=UPI0039B4A145
MIDIARPKIEGSIAVADGDRRIGFAEYGSATGRAIIWLHGTPGARRQIPVEARGYAAERGVRLIGLDRPGVGSSTPHRYENIAAFAPDLETVLEALGIGEFAIIGLSGGGPYTLGVAHAMPDRVVAAGILGGVAPTVGPDRIPGGAMRLGSFLAPAVNAAGSQIGQVLSIGLRFARPIAEPAITVYGHFSPKPTGNCWHDPSSGPCSSMTCSTADVARWRHRSPTSSSSPRTGASASPTSRCPCAGGTATTITSSRTPTASTWCRCCPTPNCSRCPARATSARCTWPPTSWTSCWRSGISRGVEVGGQGAVADSPAARPSTTAISASSTAALRMDAVSV